jgi:hypothetical protein
MPKTKPLLVRNTGHGSDSIQPKSPPYQAMDMIELMSKIFDGDQTALSELMSRPLLIFRGKRVMLLQWVSSQVERPKSDRYGSDVVLELAGDLLIDRFSRMPQERDGKTDCRNYYRGYLDALPDEWLKPGGRRSLTQLDEAMQRFQGYVQRHWQFCLKEARRREQKWLVAYDYWTEIGSRVHLYVPACIPAPNRDRWLEQLAGPIEAADKDRVQAKIDAWVEHDLRERERGLRSEIASDPFGTGMSTFVIEHGWSHNGLVRTVASEKASAPGRLRRSIAELGPERIKQLVLRIFGDVLAGTYHPSAVAKDFALHKSVMTRFAAARWQPGDAGPVPDLWSNTAQVLASRPRFRAALEEAGLDRLVQRLAGVAHNTPPQLGKEPCNVRCTPTTDRD